MAATSAHLVRASGLESGTWSQLPGEDAHGGRLAPPRLGSRLPSRGQRQTSVSGSPGPGQPHAGLPAKTPLASQRPTQQSGTFSGGKAASGVPAILVAKARPPAEVAGPAEVHASFGLSPAQRWPWAEAAGRLHRPVRHGSPQAPKNGYERVSFPVNDSRRLSLINLVSDGLCVSAPGISQTRYLNNIRAIVKAPRSVSPVLGRRTTAVADSRPAERLLRGRVCVCLRFPLVGHSLALKITKELRVRPRL